MRDSDGHIATPLDQKESERQPATTGDSEIHVVTQWDWKKK